MDDGTRDRIFEEGRLVGFEEGREVGRREGLPFAGIDPFPPFYPGVQFRFAESWVESFVAYERDLTACLRIVQRSLFFRRGKSDRAEEMALAEAQKKIEEELVEARRAVDAEVARGLGPTGIADALRGPPRRPRGVREYPSVDAFVAEDQRRALPNWPARRDAGGSDAGLNWGLEQQLRRWERTGWRISWLGNDRAAFAGRGPTNEVYAIENALPRGTAGATRRVWLLGSMPTWDDVMAVVFPLYPVRLERNSLVAAANAVSAASSVQLPPEVDY
jgi:hypothetical protein